MKLVIIRMKPDAYTEANNKKVPSPWTVTKQTGLCCIKKENASKWQLRLDLLLTSINEHITTVPQELLTIQYICYDEVRIASE